MSRASASFVSVALGFIAIACNPHSDLGLEGLACDSDGRCATGYRCDRRICVAEDAFDAGPSTAGSTSQSGDEPAIEPMMEPAIPEPAMGEPGVPAEPNAEPVMPPAEDPPLEPAAEPSPTPSTCDAPPSSVAPAECPSQCSSCTGGLCVIECASGQASCEAVRVTCPPDLDCEVRCASARACLNATLLGPREYGLRVVCQGPSSCEDATVRCEDAGSCELDCQAGKDACLDSTVQCGVGACRASCADVTLGTPNLECSEACACEGC